MIEWLRRRRYARVSTRPFPTAFADVVRRNVPAVRTLGPEQRRRLETLALLFLDRVEFVGCEGLEVTDEHRVTVAAQACLLLVGLPTADPYPDLVRVVLYPAAYVAETRAREGALEHVRDEVRLGESWTRGVVVLAWSAVRHGGLDVDDGRNVVYHEFAHQLDQAHGDADGAPELPAGLRSGAFASAMGAAYARLVADVAARRVQVLDGYGATHPAEFFAVATEAFFERPAALRAREPAVYAVLATYYGVAP